MQRDLEFRIIDCDASYDELCRRIRLRSKDPSEATVSVLEQQVQNQEPLTSDELKYVRRSE
jgi:predicted kinase